MKITLISPFPDIESFGIRTLSACLKREGYGVQLIFLPRPFYERYPDSALDEVAEISRGADLIGISLMTNFFDHSVQVTQRLKRDLNTPILWGGVHPTVRPAESLDYADMACVGEGEDAVVELARRMNAGQDYHDIQNMWFKNNGKIIQNKVRPLSRDLDSIPFPDYDYETHWVLDGTSIRKMDEGLLEKYTGARYMTLPTRGCPFGCTYCVNFVVNEMYLGQKAVRKRSADNVISELVQVKERFPFLNRIKFDDDAFFIYTTEQIREFCEKYKENIGLPLIITGATPTTVTREKIALLVDAGLTGIRMGIESGSERTKKLYQRHHSNDRIEKSVNIINEFKDKIRMPQYDIILDNPWETDEDIVDTLMFLAKLPPPYGLALFSLTFYPDTDLYRKAKEDGIVTDDLEDVYRKHFLGCNKSYLNGLFFLLSEYAESGRRISPRIMSLLTNRKLRQLRLAWLLYIALKVVILSLGPFSPRRRRLGYLLYEGLRSVRNRDWRRIIRYIKQIAPA